MSDFENTFVSALWLIPLPGLALAGLGLLWTPFGVLICVLIARFRRMEPGRYAALGARTSASALLPWVWLMTTMLSGKPMRSFMPRPLYALAYAYWFVLIAGNTAALLVYPFLLTADGDFLPASAALSIVAFGSMLAINARAIASSIRESRRRWAMDRNDAPLPAAVSPKSLYLKPFTRMMLWSLVFMLAAVAVGFAATIESLGQK